MDEPSLSDLGWRLETSLNSGYDGYKERAGNRQVPVVVCSPTSP